MANGGRRVREKAEPKAATAGEGVAVATVLGDRRHRQNRCTHIRYDTQRACVLVSATYTRAASTAVD